MNFSILHMTAEYLEQPIWVDTKKPRFGWWLESEQNGLLQKAYRIVVSEIPAGSEDTPDAGILCWDSGRCESDAQFHVIYDGAELKPETRYHWSLTVWDQDGDAVTESSYFETAFLTEDESGFEGAQWIGNQSELALDANTLSVFQMRVGLTIREGASRGGFLLGGDDPRLMEGYRNILGMEAAPGESYIRIELDLGGLESGGQAELKAYRIGYCRTDREDMPLYTVKIPQVLLNRRNCHERHEIILFSEYGQFDLFLDGSDEAHQLLHPASLDYFGFTNRRWNLNPIGRGGDYISFPVLAKTGLFEAQADSVKFDLFEIRNYRKPGNLLYSGVFEEKNTLIDCSHGGNTMLHTVFSVENTRENPEAIDRSVCRARIYATARGVYELYLNGEKVGEDYLAPGLSQYDHHQFYQVYDITGQVKKGHRQCLGVLLGEGWFSGSVSYSGANWNYFGDRNSFLCKLIIEYTDGSREVVVSSPDRFFMRQDGPILASSIFQGEYFDCRKEWMLKEFSLAEDTKSAEGWKPAEVVACDETTTWLNHGEWNPLGGYQTGLDYSNLKFGAQPDPGVKVSEILTAVSVTEPLPGVYIYDMGQNMAGIPQITLKGKEGQKILIRYAEVLYPDLPEYADKVGTMMLENIRGAYAADRYILRDGEQVLCPHFTYHGYRYVEITGTDGPLDLSQIRGLSLSSMPKLAARITTSDPEINRLYENVGWSLRDNYISIPSDCPQRNERMGWSGDLSVFGRTATYMSMSDAFLTRHMAALRDTQCDGRFNDIAPIGGGFGGTLWGSAGVTVPWEMYLQYGDVRTLEEMYASMLDYVKFLASKKDDNGIVREGPLGDWLGPENEKNECAYLWQAYYIYDLRIVKMSAKIIGRNEDLPWLEAEYQSARETFARFYLDPETGQSRYSDRTGAMSLNSPFGFGEKETAPEQRADGSYLMDTQTSYAVAYGLDMAEEDPELAAKIGARLNASCTRTNINDLKQVCEPYTLMTGFIGTSWVCPSLSDAGYQETAWRMLKSRNYPSWLYPVLNGATTIWERLNSYTIEDGFGGNNNMNSFNHYSFGAIAYWMLAYAGGIRRSGEAGRFMLCPVPDPDGDVTWAKTSVETVSGGYRMEWKREGDEVHYQFHIPGGRATKVELLCEKEQQKALAMELRKMDTISQIRCEENKIVFCALPGTYTLMGSQGQV